MEGKEVRFGIANSALFTVITTDASCGAVNNMHDSLTPLGGLVPLVNIELGEVVFGGVGSGLYGMLLFAILAVFIAGLMVGRTPEYLGKKIEQKEVKMMMLAVLVLAFTILGFGRRRGAFRTTGSTRGGTPAWPTTARTGFPRCSTPTPARWATTAAPSPASTPTRRTSTSRIGLAMLFGRFLMMIPLLAAAGSLAQKKLVPVSAGTFPTHGPLFVALLVGVVLIVGALTFFPALSLGPGRGTFPDAPREALELTMTVGNRDPCHPSRDDVTSLIPKKGCARASAVRSAHREARHRRFVRQAEPARR